MTTTRNPTSQSRAVTAARCTGQVLPAPSGAKPTQSTEISQALLSLDELAPTYNSCSEKIYIEIFQRASKCNEERVRRDLTPHIVPSAELLYLVDGEIALENVREEMSGDWTKCSLLGGTQPRPDYAYTERIRS